MKSKRTNKAISEIIGTVLLLAMAVSLFTVVYVFVINETLNPNENPPTVYIAGTTEGKDIIFENRGGKSLPSDTILCFLSVAGQKMNMTVGPYLQDKNGNGLWDVGEKLRITSTTIGIDITGLQVEAAIIDRNTDSLIMSGTLQEGEIFEFPYVITLDATDVESDRAKLWMQYNFRANYTGDLRFAYRESTGDWNYTSWFVGQSGEGSYGLTVTGLTAETTYNFKAELQYDNETEEDLVKKFKTLGVLVGMWHFDTGSGTIAIDSSGRDNHGTLYNGPQWTAGVNSTTALTYDGIDDYVMIPDESSLDITDEITIEAWMNPLENSEGYYGKITGPLIDSSSFGIFNIYDPDIVHVYDDVYAVACQGDGNDGFIVTIEIADDGSICYTLMDIWEFYSGDCYDPDIIHIDGNIYAITFRTSSYQGYIRTVEIYNNGIINNLAKDTFNFDSTYKEPHIYHIFDTVYVVGYTGPGYDGYFRTIRIENNGQITGSIDSICYDTAITGYSEEPNMIKVGSDIYAIAYRNPDSDGELRTLQIQNDGQIVAADHFDGAYIGKFPFDIFDGFEPNITHVNGNIYVIAYGGFKSAGTIRTVEIYNDGSIRYEVIDGYEFDSGIGGYGREPSIIHLDGDIYAIAYRGPEDDGWLKTVKVYNNGTIYKGIIDSYEFDTTTCFEPSIIRIKNDVYAIIYRGLDDDGLVKTIKIANNGIISKPEVDYSEIGIFDCQLPDVIYVSGNIYALAFRGFYDDGYIRTVEISNDGSINDSIIDSFKFQSGNVIDPKLIHINGEIFAIVYSNYESPSWHGCLKTISVNSYGNITEIDYLDFDSTQGIRPDIVHVNGNVYAIAYRGPGHYGYVKTVTITNTGTISVTGMDTEQFYNSYCYYPDITHVIGDIYAIAHTGSGNDGFLDTVKIESTGAITTGIDNLEFDTSYCVFSKIINVTEEIFAIVYMGPGSDGYVKTVKIDSNGTIIGGVIDYLEFDTSYGYRPDIIHIKNRVFAVAYTGSSYHGYLKTFRIGERGDITNSVDSNYKFYSWYTYDCRIIPISDNIFAITYRNYYSDGIINTIKIDYTPTVGYILARSNSYRLNANSTTIFAYLYGSSGGYKLLTAPITSGFNYVTLTYNKNAGSNQMKLYINSVLKSQTSYTDSIKTNSNNLYFGWLNSVVDEIILWRTEMSPVDISLRYTELTSTG
jgi:flagellin-like protein